METVFYLYISETDKTKNAKSQIELELVSAFPLFKFIVSPFWPNNSILLQYDKLLWTIQVKLNLILDLAFTSYIDKFGGKHSQSQTGQLNQWENKNKCKNNAWITCRFIRYVIYYIHFDETDDLNDKSTKYVEPLENIKSIRLTESTENSTFFRLSQRDTLKAYS